MHKQRWTLVETLVVVAIIVILTGMLIPAMQSCNKQTASKHTFKAGDVVELVLDKRKAMVLIPKSMNPNTLRTQVEIRVVGSEKTMFVEPCEIKIKD